MITGARITARDRRPAQPRQHAGRLRGRRRHDRGRSPPIPSGSRSPTSAAASSARSSPTRLSAPLPSATPISRASSSTSACATCCSRRSTATACASSPSPTKASELVARARRHRGEVRARDVPDAHPRPRPRRARARRQRAPRAAIDLAGSPTPRVASLDGDDAKVLELLGAWPAPLAIFLRTPEGQMLAPEPRALIAKGLGLLGTACVRLGDVAQGEEIFRLGIQYAQDGVAAADIFQRLGEALMNDDRPARRSARSDGPSRSAATPRVLWPLLVPRLLSARPLRRRLCLACARPSRPARPRATSPTRLRAARRRARTEAHRLAGAWSPTPPPRPRTRPRHGLRSV